MKTSVIVVIVVAILLAIPVGWYLISPAFETVEADEPSPVVAPSDPPKEEVEETVEEETPEEEPEEVPEEPEMDEETKAEMEKQIEDVKDDVVEMEDDMPEEARILSQADFEEKAHEVEGRALLIEEGDTKTLRFEDFDTINGPDLRIYLSTSLHARDGIELSKIKATKGNVNYDVDSSIDTEEYNNVLVWCKPFGVLFSYASLE